VAADNGHPGLDRRRPLRAVDARIVLDATVVLDRPHGGDRTEADGPIPPKRHAMSKNFSMPMSEPNPDSVTT